jgi:hypothetical protein
MRCVCRIVLSFLIAWPTLSHAQEVKYIDLTFVQLRTELRHPPAPPPECKDGRCSGRGIGGDSVGVASEQLFGYDNTGIQSARALSFDQRLDKRVERFDTAGRTLLDHVIDLAFRFQLPTAIEYVDHDATTPLNLQFHNESVRGILETIVRQVPSYRVSFSGGIVDIFASRGREDSSNLLNKTIKDFAVNQVDTHEADLQLFCAIGRDVGSQACGGSIAPGQWGPLKITVHLQNARAYEILNAIVAENGRAIWTVMVRPDKLSKLQFGGIWYIYPLQQPFKAVVSERLASLSH